MYWRRASTLNILINQINRKIGTSSDSILYNLNVLNAENVHDRNAYIFIIRVLLVRLTSWSVHTFTNILLWEPAFTGVQYTDMDFLSRENSRVNSLFISFLIT